MEYHILEYSTPFNHTTTHPLGERSRDLPKESELILVQGSIWIRLYPAGKLGLLTVTLWYPLTHSPCSPGPLPSCKILRTSGSQNVVQRWAASVTPGNSSDMQVPGPQPQTWRILTLEVSSPLCVLTRPAGDSDAYKSLRVIVHTFEKQAPSLSPLYVQESEWSAACSRLQAWHQGQGLLILIQPFPFPSGVYATFLPKSF